MELLGGERVVSEHEGPPAYRARYSGTRVYSMCLRVTTRTAVAFQMPN